MCSDWYPCSLWNYKMVHLLCKMLWKFPTLSLFCSALMEHLRVSNFFIEQKFICSQEWRLGSPISSFQHLVRFFLLFHQMANAIPSYPGHWSIDEGWAQWSQHLSSGPTPNTIAQGMKFSTHDFGEHIQTLAPIILPCKFISLEIHPGGTNPCLE
jgi:hypothetical protein